MLPVPMTERDTLRARAEALQSARSAGALGRGRRPKPGSRRCSIGRSRSAPAAAWSVDCSTAHIGRFKPLCDFDWTWPKRCDRAAVDALMTLDFLNDATNVVLVGPNGVGKSTLAQNIAHQALIHGHTVLFTSAGQLLGDLCALDSDSALRRRLRHYARPQLLVIDEVGYLSYSNRHADLMFELISRRYQNKSTLVTTNRTVRRMARGVPQRRLRRLAGRPSRAQRRDRRHRGRILSPQGSPRTHRTARPPAPRRQVMSTPPEPSQPPAHLRPLTVEIPLTWTPEEALAVFELIDELRDKIWALYNVQLQDLLREQCARPSRG